MALVSVNAGIIRVYGGMPSGDVQVQSLFSPTNQNVGEVLPVAAYRRRVPGTNHTAHSSFHVIVDSAAGAGSAMNLFVSNLPDPSLASDADWFDSGVTAIDLTTTGSKFVQGNSLMYSQWIMLKANILVSPGTIRAFVKIEGLEKQ